MAWVTSWRWAERARSLRWRVAAALAALALLTILAQSLTWLWLLERQEDAFINQQLHEQMAHSMALWREHPEAALPNSPAMWLYREPFRPSSQRVEAPPQFAHLPVGDHEVFIGSHEYHVLVRADAQARYILVYDVEDHEFRLNRLFWSTLAAALLLALTTLGAGYWLAGRLTRRLGGLAEAVEREVPEALADPAMEREVLALAEAFDRQRNRQREAMARERAFAANLSHELRTPLTAIRTDAELLSQLPDLPAAVARRGARIVAGVDRINSLAASLLLLAREARPGERLPLALAGLLDEVWQRSLDAVPAGLPVPQLENAVAVDCQLLADPALFELVLRNIFDNALRYSADGTVRCWLADDELAVQDSGPGFAADELGHVFDRFYIGRRGLHGLGLALVRHVSQACGWQVTAENAATGGGLIRLRFAPGDLTIPSHTVD
ncbi:HAMP domain-containing sensor histidine kinase [Dechloromonas sp. ZY10]|uniref:sensor histidine kinase n=1 Tax=Dechloromonas aquae TaxID=2664436 RepID=UPI00352800D0